MNNADLTDLEFLQKLDEGVTGRRAEGMLAVRAVKMKEKCLLILDTYGRWQITSEGRKLLNRAR